ncbi:hypothetical protein CGLO_09346 [Colletotrichum gloeosporioides Cg-14]|uniref:Uncharacterized protein n=1 Tax=Colletotrichum gloeosporioides (strain Cg-14) TaxID=1237896 RepID=T0K6N6_COLGC|nr:hypothetical protein CGLO_09346 [Colletotrichum gloeosporioides Cg-14]
MIDTMGVLESGKDGIANNAVGRMQTRAWMPYRWVEGSKPAREEATKWVGAG